MNIFILRHRFIIALILGVLALVYVMTTKNQTLPENTSEKISFSKEEIKWVKKNPVISVGVDPDFAPIEDLDKDDNYIGVTADFLALVEKSTGLAFKIDHKHSWEESIERVKTGKIHMLGAAVPSEQRKRFLNFTQPYAWLSGVIIVRKNVTEPMSLEKLKGMQVAVVHNYIWKDILENSYPELKITSVPNIQTALKKVSFGMADAMVGYMATASHHIEQLGISNLKISGDTVSVLNISFAVSKDIPHLKNIFNRVLEQTPEVRKKAILRKWISLELRPPMDLKYFTRIVFPGVVLGLLVLIGIIIWNRSLRRQVTQRTETLNQELIQRTRIELALRESEEKYRSIFGNIQDVYYEIMPRGQVLEISPSIEKVIGYARATILHTSLSRLFVNPEDFHKMLDKVIQDERLEDYEALLAQPDKEMLNCSMNAMLILDSSGKAIKIIGSIRNITARVKAQKELKTAYHELEKRVEERTAELQNTNEEMNKAKETADAATLAKSSFLANMSHEIRTPLNGVISASELVMNESLPKKVARYINLIHTSGHALLGVIDDILDFSKIEAGKLEMEIHPFLLDQVIARVTDLFKPKMNEKQIRFVKEIKTNIPLHLMGDSFRLQQILTNLIGNAIKFTDQGGQITLRVETLGSNANDPVQISFLVADTGIGIASEHQNLLFTPFSQIDASTTRKYGGSGLGLSICGQLVEMMGGTITVESYPQKGSKFLFTIPLGLCPASATDQASLATLPGNLHSIETYRKLLKGRRVLVAEDTPTNQEITLAVLELAGIETMLVNTGTRAVSAIESHKFDAVLMDIQMPEMDGLEATRAIRKQKSQARLPIIAMTAHTLKEDRAKCLAAGMSGYISKPVSREKLFNTLIALIHKTNRIENLILPGSVKTAQNVSTKKTVGDMPGIEIETAINALGVSMDVFMDILQTFSKNHEQTISKIETGWQNQDRETVVALVHSLKGSAGGIGATKLYGLALELEQVCRQERCLPSPRKAGLNHLKNSIAVVLASIQTLGKQQKSEKTVSRLILADQPKAKSLLIQLEKALALPELGELEALMEALESVLDHPNMAEIKNHIISHDHDLAKDSVKKLQSLLEAAIP